MSPRTSGYLSIIESTRIMATIIYYTRQSKGKDPVAIYCRFRDGRKVEQRARTGLTVTPDHWNAKKERVKNVAEATYKDFTNEKLDNLRTHVYSHHAKTDGLISSGWLSETIDLFHNPDGKKDKPKTLFEFIQDFIEKAPTRLNPKTSRPVCYKMQREYIRTFEYLKEFAGRKHLDFKDIDLDFYHDFIEFLQNKNIETNPEKPAKHMATNTVGKKIQTLKIFLNAAADAGINKYHKYKSTRFISPSEETDHIYLNVEELEKIASATLPKELDPMRDLFLIGCWTGLRFSDWNKVQDSMKDGMLHIKQQKTRHKVVIPLHPVVIGIINKYEGKLPMVPTNQHMNRSLKTIAEKAGLDDKVQTTITRGGIERTTSHKKYDLVSTHTARRSFATNAYKMDIPSITIMAITGHRTESSFLKYIKVAPEEHAEKIREIWNRGAMRAIVNE